MIQFFLQVFTSPHILQKHITPKKSSVTGRYIHLSTPDSPHIHLHTSFSKCRAAQTQREDALLFFFLGCVCSLLLFLVLCSAMLTHCIPFQRRYNTQTHTLSRQLSQFIHVNVTSHFVFCHSSLQLIIRLNTHKPYMSSWLKGNNQHFIKCPTLNKNTL